MNVKNLFIAIATAQFVNANSFMNTEDLDTDLANAVLVSNAIQGLANSNQYAGAGTYLTAESVLLNVQNCITLDPVMGVLGFVSSSVELFG